MRAFVLASTVNQWFSFMCMHSSVEYSRRPVICDIDALDIKRARFNARKSSR